MKNMKWEHVKSIPIGNEINLKQIIPKKNMYQSEIEVFRTIESSIDIDLWSAIKDQEYDNDYIKENFVKDYFSICVYTLKRVQSVPISANTSIDKTVDIRHTSTYRTSENKKFRIENVFSSGFEGKGITLKNDLTIEYEISKIDEYSQESSKSTTETIRYNESDNDRMIVFWDLVKNIIIYRTNSDDITDMIAINDYYVETIKKTYLDTKEDVE